MENGLKEKVPEFVACRHCGASFAGKECPFCAHLSPTERRHLELLCEIRDLLKDKK